MGIRSKCCMDCELRHAGCHAECEIYKAAKAELEVERKNRQEESDYLGYVAEAARTMKRRRRRKDG